MTARNWRKVGDDRRMARRGTESISGARSAAGRSPPSPPAAPRTSKLAVPVTIAKFWKNRGGEAVVVQLREYENRAICDARVYFTDSAGRLAPSKKGLAITLPRLPALIAALQTAERKARELGLIVDGTERGDD